MEIINFFLNNNDNIERNKSNSMIIETNKEYYFKGEIIEGNIILDCISNITLKEITISFSQNESWLIQETSDIKYGEKNNQLLSKFDLGINKILNDNNEIKTLSPGRYIFPFKIELPKYLQPSFEYPIANRSGYIRYILESEVISNSIKLSTRNYILIKAGIKRLMTPKSYNAVTNVHKWGIIDGGSTILKVSYKKNNYKIDEIAPLDVEIDNTRGKLKVSQCKIRVIRIIQFSRLNKASMEKYPLEKTILTKVFSAEVFPNSKRNFLFGTELKDKDLLDYTYINAINPYPNIKDINILLPSVEGGIIKCEYRLQVSVYFDNFVTANYRPRVSLPIVITHQYQEEDNSIIQNEDIIMISSLNKFNNNYCGVCTASSLLFDNNYQENYNINNNSNIINNKSEKKDLFYDKDYMNKSSQIKDEKNNNIPNSNNNNNNKKPNFVELKEESYYNINDY